MLILSRRAQQVRPGQFQNRSSAPQLLLPRGPGLPQPRIRRPRDRRSSRRRRCLGRGRKPPPWLGKSLFLFLLLVFLPLLFEFLLPYSSCYIALTHILSLLCRAALEVAMTGPSGNAPVPPPTAEVVAPPPTQEVRVDTPPPSHPAPKQATAGVTDPAALDSVTERSPPATEPTPTPKSPPPQARQPAPTDAQKKKELLLKEQRKLKQS